MYVTYGRIVKILNNAKYLYLIFPGSGVLWLLGLIIMSFFLDPSEKDAEFYAFFVLTILYIIITLVVALIAIARHKVPAHDNYIVTKDCIEDIRLTYGGHKMVITIGGDDHHKSPDHYFSFQALQKYHQYGYIKLTVWHSGIKPGTEYILVKEPTSNKIVLTFPSEKNIISRTDSRLIVVEPQDLQMFPNLPKGEIMNDENSWPENTTLKDSLKYLGTKLNNNANKP